MKIWCSRGDAKAGGGEEKGELATIFHKFSFTPRKTAGHRKAWKLLRKHEPHQNNVFYHWLIFVFIHWKTNVNMSDRIRAQYFDSRFVYIWKVVYIQKTSKLPVAITNWRTAFSWTWFSFVLLQLLPTRFIVLFIVRFIVRSTANSSSATLMYMLLNFSTQWNSIGRSDAGRQRLNRVLDFLFTFTLLIFRAKQGAWLKRN